MVNENKNCVDSCVFLFSLCVYPHIHVVDVDELFRFGSHVPKFKLNNSGRALSDSLFHRSYPPGAVSTPLTFACC